jgi:CheY-like chemotaxis protein
MSEFSNQPFQIILTFGMMKVLIVDDNEQVRLLLRDYLPASANEVFECADGGEAISFFRKNQPDWVLMDWEMPNTNGITAIREIIAEFPKANICMVTAFDDEEIRTEAFAAGASGFVLKDNLFELEELLELRLQP